MGNLFKRHLGRVNKVPRISRDVSFQNNISTQIGRLTPVLCKEVIPNETIHLDAGMALRAMPMVFPIQTRLRAHLHYFFVPNRILWKDWEDFIFGTKDGLISPWAKITSDKQKASMLATGSLGDYLDIATTRSTTSFPIDKEVSIISNFNTPTSNFAFLTGYLSEYTSGDFTTNFSTTYSSLANFLRGATLSTASVSNLPLHAFQINPFVNNFNSVISSLKFRANGVISSRTNVKVALYVDGSLVYSSDTPMVLSADYNFFTISFSNTLVNKLQAQLDYINNFHPEYKETEYYTKYRLYILSYATDYSDNTNNILSATPFPSYLSDGSSISSLPPFYTSFVQHNEEASLDPSNVFVGSSPLKRLNVLPFRAYTAACNAYYRNEMINPLKIGGIPEYNKYVPTQDGGEDTNLYCFHYRNWELDQFTSCLFSPQYGQAPLVGVTLNPSNGTATLNFSGMTVTNPDGTTETMDGQLDVGVDADGTINKIYNHQNIPSGDLHRLMDMIGAGISINDFRNVNSFQRYLENAQRLGFKYRDQMLSHHHVDVGYKDIWMPEFLGGFSCDFNVNQINQTVGTEQSPLGDYAGQGNFIGQSKNHVSHYVREHGFIIGILSIIPNPVYTQSMPRIWFKHDKLDYYSPEFSKIGYVPVFNHDITPLECDSSNIDGVFGYQRAWYDYDNAVDEAHGLFRTQLKNFVMQRNFTGVPELSEQFIQCLPNQVNDVFAVQHTTQGDNLVDDKFIGLVYFKMVRINPIPMSGIAALE